MNLKLPLTLIDFVICTTKCRVKQDLVHVSQEILVKGTQDAIIDLAALLAKVCMHLFQDLKVFFMNMQYSTLSFSVP